MKKTVAITSLVALAAVAVLSPLTASAAPVGPALGTDGTIKFTDSLTPETGTIVKPNENDLTGSKEEPITLPGKGSNGSGSLRIQFVPNFAFGEKAGFTSDAQEQNVKVIEYSNAAGVATGKYIPPFVQVTNNTGDANVKWKLNAKATKFVQVDAAGVAVPGGHELTGAHISLNGSSLTTTKGDTAGAGLLADKQAAAVIPFDGTSSVTVLSSKGDTNGKQISNVFHDNYVENGTYATGDSAGVKFIKPSGVSARKDVNYKSIITWTLEDSY